MNKVTITAVMVGLFAVQTFGGYLIYRGVQGMEAYSNFKKELKKSMA